MRLRPIVFVVYLANFLIAIGAILSIPSETWNFLAETQPWMIALYVYLVLLAFGSVAIAFWLWKDEDYIDQLYNELVRLREKARPLLDEYEKKQIRKRLQE